MMIMKALRLWMVWDAGTDQMHWPKESCYQETGDAACGETGEALRNLGKEYDTDTLDWCPKCLEHAVAFNRQKAEMDAYAASGQMVQDLADGMGHAINVVERVGGPATKVYPKGKEPKGKRRTRKQSKLDRMIEELRTALPGVFDGGGKGKVRR